MTVAELIKRLADYDPDAEVVTQASYSGPTIFTDVVSIDLDPDTREVRLYGRDQPLYQDMQARGDYLYRL